ncbi:hypothetical protein [Hymenobacter psychrotolerans]|uniref:Uncharacterized protein n=1 Tax=Hymenobacter psychrotolerans DSM 18569 TaxID=1121959 RepID=A0A1M6QAD3_9BACT|nr:hypothetical protein [Hymenobacter psychrotolerans]SHK17057.1 hypothetical protein SAMN02746009_00495 [Hymenobacter psychrotolerans DSM 18569]
MTLNSPPNDLPGLYEEHSVASGNARRILQTLAYIALMVGLLYLLYSSFGQPLPRKKLRKKPWPISQGFLLLQCRAL